MAAERIASHLRTQAGWCARLGSPLYAFLLERAAVDAESGGAVGDLLVAHAENAAPKALGLRSMGVVHRLVLTGRAPALARHYPSAGGTVGDLEAAWTDFHETVAREVDVIRPLLERNVQTNEVGRAASLFGGFLRAAESGLPLRLLEVGSSAGLNLRWDRFRYEWQGSAFGPTDSPVRFVEPFAGAAPARVPVEIAERRGCDASPIDPVSEDGRLTLLCYVWPDQGERFARLRGALDVAASMPAVIDQADACEWLAARLAGPLPGVATVVFHSIVLQYLGREGAARLRRIVEEAGERATAEAPLFWLRLEPEQSDGEWIYPVRLTSWPGGDDRRLAISSPHGPPVEWSG